MHPTSSAHHILAFLLAFFCSLLLAGKETALCLGPATGARTRSRPAEQGAVFRSESMAVYVVKRGDKLRDLARRFYGDPDKAWMIEDANDSVALEPGQVLVIPLQPTNPGGLFPEGYQVVPILTYHHFCTRCSNLLCMPIDEFSRQMAFLEREGYRVITLRQMLKFLEYEATLPRKAVAITIDDGYRSAYTLAYPVLQRHNFKATLFIYTDFIGSSPNALTWEQLQEMARAGFEVEAHTISHADLTRKLEGEGVDAYCQRIRRELEVPRRLIEEHVGQQAVWLAYPYGRVNNLVITMAKEAGYRAAVTVRRGPNPFFQDPFKVRRYQVMNPAEDRPFVEMLETIRKEALQ